MIVQVDLAKKLVRFLFKVFDQDIKFRIIIALAKREALTLRELARNVGISPKNLYKYLAELNDKGIITYIEVSPRIKVYTLSRDYEWLKDLIKNVHQES